MVITIRTDKPEAEIGLYDESGRDDYYTWPAGKELSNTILIKIRDLLSANKLELNDIEGIVVFTGPGSFTGLRIGITVANTLAYGQNARIVGTKGKDWIKDGLKRIKSRENDNIVIPEYGKEANITKPVK